MDASSSFLEEDVITPKITCDELRECTFAAKRETPVEGLPCVCFATLQLRASALLRALPRCGHVKTVITTGSNRLVAAEVWLVVCIVLWQKEKQ